MNEGTEEQVVCGGGFPPGWSCLTVSGCCYQIVTSMGTNDEYVKAEVHSMGSREVLWTFPLTKLSELAKGARFATHKR